MTRCRYATLKKQIARVTTSSPLPWKTVGTVPVQQFQLCQLSDRAIRKGKPRLSEFARQLSKRSLAPHLPSFSHHRKPGGNHLEPCVKAAWTHLHCRDEMSDSIVASCHLPRCIEPRSDFLPVKRQKSSLPSAGTKCQTTNGRIKYIISMQSFGSMGITIAVPTSSFESSGRPRMNGCAIALPLSPRSKPKKPKRPPFPFQRLSRGQRANGSRETRSKPVPLASKRVLSTLESLPPHARILHSSASPRLACLPVNPTILCSFFFLC